jgi:cysteine desulfuration protein SufE
MQYDNLNNVSLIQLEQAQNWQAKYRLITDWGKLISSKQAIREPQYLVKGCETSAWLIHSCDGSYHRFAFDSESRVINGLAALLLSLIDKKTTSELVQINVKDILRDAGLEKHMTPSRNNGFKTIVERAFYLAGVTASL